MNAKRETWETGVAAVLALTMTCQLGFGASIALDEETPWPRTRSANGNTVILHLPQVERWTSNSFVARTPVQVKLDKTRVELFGVVWFEAHGTVDCSNRRVKLDSIEIIKTRFPEATDEGKAAEAALRQVLPSGARTISLDYLITALGFLEAAARQGPSGLSHTPPEILWVTNRTVLVRIDGEPMLRSIPGTTLERVVNTPAFLLLENSSRKFYLWGDGKWFSADSVKGPWLLVQQVPPNVESLSPAADQSTPTAQGEPGPQIIVSTSPAELLNTSGLPDFRPISGTSLQYAADSDCQLFFYTTDRKAYLLVSGRWFKADSLNGPWTHVSPRDLPGDFAKIPRNSPQAIVLASVPDTKEADLAVLANSIPTTVTVSRRDTRIELSYDGEPKFQSIEGTALSYAVNAQLPVVRAGTNYYALDDGVWFLALSATGPWTVASEVPEEIYTIPPSSPVYYATFARIYNATGDEVEVGYTAGYQGAYEDEGTVVYGTGWNYEPWQGNQYYGWGWTWGYSYTYVPWYQWWVWRPWWTPPGGLRAAVIENIYDRWQGRNGVMHYDRTSGSTPGSLPNAEGRVSGHPAIYGRHWPLARSAPSAATSAAGTRSGARTASAGSTASAASTRPALSAPQALPANTLALNPYARPETPIRSGDRPRGAQLLSSVRQTDGGGRDLYASPDGSVYQKRADGWYRREAGGGWNFYAARQGGGIQRNQVASGITPGFSGGAYRPSAAQVRAGGRGKAPGNRVPNSGFEPRAQQVAALERQYYARALSQARAQNWRASANHNRAGRAAGARRR